MSPTPRELWGRLIAQLRLPVDLSTLWPIHEEASRVLVPRLYDYLGRMGEFWTEFNRFILRRLEIPDPENRLAARITEAFQALELELFHLFPEATDVLNTLKGNGYHLHVISNATDELPARLERLDLSSCFETVTFSQEARAEKPDPAVFRLALGRARCRPDEAVYVGNDHEADVVGARGMGMLPILIDREERYPAADCLRIRSLTELPAVVERL